MVTKQLTYTEALEQLRVSYGQEKILLTSTISTLEVAVGQQTIQIKKLEEHVQELQVAGRAERDNAQEGWDLANSYDIKIKEYQEIIDEQVIEIKNLQMDVKKLGG